MKDTTKSEAGIHLEGVGVQANKYTYKAHLHVDAAVAQNSNNSHISIVRR